MGVKEDEGEEEGEEENDDDVDEGGEEEALPEEIRPPLDGGVD